MSQQPNLDSVKPKEVWTLHDIPLEMTYIKCSSTAIFNWKEVLAVKCKALLKKSILH